MLLAGSDYLDDAVDRDFTSPKFETGPDDPNQPAAFMQMADQDVIQSAPAGPLLPPPVQRPLAPRIGPPTSQYNQDQYRGRNMMLNLPRWMTAQAPERTKEMRDMLANSVDPELTQARLTNVFWMAEKKQVDAHTVLAHYDDFRDGFAAQNHWDDAIGNDRAFNKHAKELATKDEEESKLTFGSFDNTPEASELRDKSIVGRAQDFALKLPPLPADQVGPMPDDQAFAERAWAQVAPEIRKQPGFRPENMDAYAATFIQQIKSTHEQVRQADIVAEALSQILHGKGAAGAEEGGAEKATGSVVGSEARNKEAADFLWQLPVAVRNLAMQRFQENPAYKGAEVPGVFSVGTALERMTEALKNKVVNQFKKAGSVVGGNATGSAQYGHLLSYQELQSNVTDLASGTAFPIDRHSFTGQVTASIGDTLPLMALMAIGPAGWAVSAAAYTQESDAESVRNGTAPEKAAILAPIQGGAKMALDLMEFKIVSAKFPAFGNALNKLSGGLLGKASGTAIGAVAGRAVGIGITETGQELTQDFLVDQAVNSIAHSFDDTIYARTWNQTVDEMKEALGPTFVAMVPWMLLGVGIGHASDIKNAEVLVKDADAMTKLRFRPEDIAKIQAAPAGEAVAAFREGWGRREKGRGAFISEAPESLAHEAEAAKDRASRVGSAGPTSPETAGGSEVADTRARETVEGAPATPEPEAFPLHRDDQGWYLMDGETRIDGGSFDVAKHLQNRLNMAVTAQGAQAWVSLAGDLVNRKVTDIATLTGEAVKAESGEGGTSVTAFKKSGAGVSARAIPYDAETLAQLDAEMKHAGLTSASIQGSNEAIRDALGKVNNAITANISSEGILTLIHEGAERQFRAGRATPEETMAAARALQPVFAHDQQISQTLSGIAGGDVTSAAAQETLMKLLVANELGRRKDGTRFTPGAITAGFMDALRIAGGKEARSGIRKFAAMAGAIKKYFKALFSGMHALAKARAEGKDLKDFDAFADKLLGIDGETKSAMASAETAGKMAEKASGESFSLSKDESREPVTYEPKGKQQLPEGGHGDLYNVIAPGNPNHGSTFIVKEGASPEEVQREAEQRAARSFSVSPHSSLDILSAAIERRLAKNPEARLQMAEQALVNVEKLRDKWKNISEKRTAESLQNEQDMRQALDRQSYEAHGVPSTQARDMAAKNAAKWRKEVDAQQSADWQAAALTRDLQTLNAIMAALPAEIRSKIGGFITLSKLATPEARTKEIVKRVDKAGDVVEKYLKDEYETAITKLADKAGPSREAGDKPKGKLGAEGHALVDAVQENIALSKAEAQAKVDGLISAIAKETDPEKAADMSEQLNLALRFGALGEQETHTAADLADSYKWLKDNIDRERSKWRVQEEARLAEVKRLQAGTVDSIGAADLADVTDVQGKKKHGMSTIRASVVSIPGGLRALFGEHAEVTKRWRRKLREGINAFLDDSAAMEKEFNDMLRTHFGAGTPGRKAFYKLMETSKETGITITPGGALKTVTIPAETARKILDGGAAALAKAYSKVDLERMREALDANDARGKEEGDRQRPLKEISFKQPLEGKEKPLNISQAKAIQLSLAWAQEQGRTPMEAHGFTDKSMEQVESFLSPQAKAFREWIREHYKGEHAGLNEVFSRMQGVALPQIPNYAPLAFKAEGKTDSGGVDPFSGPMMDAGGMGVGMLKTRVERHTAQPEIKDAFSVFFRHMKQTSYFRNMAETVREMRNVLGSVDVQNAVLAKHGEKGTGLVSNMLKILDAGGSIAKSGIGDEWINKISSARAVASLSLNPATVLKNSAAIMNLAYRMPAGEFSKGLVKLGTGNLGWKKMIDSPTIQRRLFAGAGPEMQLALAGLKGTSPSRLKDLMQKGLMPIAWMDAYTTAGSAAIAHDYYKRTILEESPGMSDAEVEREATAQLEETLGDVAQPISFLDKSVHELQRGALARLIFMFQSEPRQKVALQIEAGAEGDRATLLRGIAINAMVGVAMQAIAAMWRDMRDDDDDELFDAQHWNLKDFAIAAVLGPWTALPSFAGPILETVVNKVKGVAFDNSLASDASKITQSAISIYSTLTKEDASGELKSKEPVEKVLHAAEALTQAASVLIGAGEYGAAARVAGYFFDVADNLHLSPDEKEGMINRIENKMSREDDPKELEKLQKRLDDLQK